MPLNIITSDNYLLGRITWKGKYELFPNRNPDKLIKEIFQLKPKEYRKTKTHYQLKVSYYEITKRIQPLYAKEVESPPNWDLRGFAWYNVVETFPNKKLPAPVWKILKSKD